MGAFAARSWPIQFGVESALTVPTFRTGLPAADLVMVKIEAKSLGGLGGTKIWPPSPEKAGCRLGESAFFHPGLRGE